MIGRVFNSAYAYGQVGIQALKSQSTLHGPVCGCKACQSQKQLQSSQAQYFNFTQAPPNYINGTQAANNIVPFPGVQQPNTNQQPSSDQQPDPNDETPNPALDALIPPKEEVQKNKIVQDAASKLPVDIHRKEAEDCLSQNATLIDPNDPKHQALKECISEIPQDLKDQQKGLEQVYTGYDPVTHAYFEIVDKRVDRKSNPMGFKQLIQFTLAHARKDPNNTWINPYVLGVEMHERLHESILRSIPDVTVESFNQGVRFCVTGTTNDPKFEVSTFGQSVFYADAIYDKVDQNEQTYRKGQETFNQAATKGFNGWDQVRFNKFLEGNKAIIQNLKFLAQEATTLATAAVAPLALDGTIYYEHEVLSKADKERYKEALQLRDYINNLIKDIQGFMQQAVKTWNGRGK